MDILLIAIVLLLKLFFSVIVLWFSLNVLGIFTGFKKVFLIVIVYYLILIMPFSSLLFFGLFALLSLIWVIRFIYDTSYSQAIGATLLFIVLMIAVEFAFSLVLKPSCTPNYVEYSDPLMEFVGSEYICWSRCSAKYNVNSSKFEGNKCYCDLNNCNPKSSEDFLPHV